jgi:probable HAF family extracellular repeat protein
VAGFSNTAGNTGEHATVWNGTTATDLGTLGGTYSGARAINNVGQVVGAAATIGDHAVHATLWNGTTATDLGTLPGGTSSVAYDINNAGQIVGLAQTTAEAGDHAFLWNGTALIDLNSFLDASTVSAGWVLMLADSINDNGWIVGQALNANTGTVSHAFLLTPVMLVPEPETYAMFMAGIGLMGFIARRRKNGQA